jgi:hypothetical protein
VIAFATVGGFAHSLRARLVRLCFDFLALALTALIAVYLLWRQALDALAEPSKRGRLPWRLNCM